MTNKRSMRRSKGRGGGEILEYRGPVQLPAGALDQRITSINMTNAASADTTGAGLMAYQWNTTNATSCTDWGSAANIYQEYRVVGMRLHYINSFNGSYNATIPPFTGAVAVYHQPVTAVPASLDEVLQNADFKYVHTGSSFTVEWKARGPEEMAFIDVSATNNHGGFKLYANTGAFSTSYGRFVMTYLIQFRGRK